MKNNNFGPYSPIRKAGSIYFVSGQVGVDPETKKTNIDVKAQTFQALKNLEAVINSHGLELKQVVKITAFLVSMDDFSIFNSVYEKFFDVPRPARSTVAVKELPRVGGENNILVEIEAVVCHEETS